MSATDRSSSASTYARRSRAAAGFYTLNPGVKKSLYSGAGGQENSAKVAGLLGQPLCPCPPPMLYTVVYNGNGFTGGSAPVDPASPYKAGSTVTLLGSGTLIRSGYLFTGWNTAADGSGTSFSVGDSFSVMGNAVLYAQWVLLPSYTVIYDGNGATGGTVPVDSLSPYAAGSPVIVLGNTGGLTINDGSFFGGWNDGTTSYFVGSTFTINANIILYASWYNDT